MPLSRVLAALTFGAFAAAACAACGGTTPASQLAKPPDFSPADETKCGWSKSQSEPLIVEWPSAARGELESIVENKKTVAVVRYEGCHMRVLPTCSAPGKVAYLPFRNSKQDQVRIRNNEELYANLPVGAAGLEGRLQQSGELDVDMTLVGRYEVDKNIVLPEELQGDCTGATHIVRAVTVGAFDFHAGANAAVSGGAHLLGAGVAAGSSAEQENIARDGRVDACAAAKSADQDPPDNCGALIRIEVVPLGEPKKVAPTCPAGTQWDGTQCVGKRVVTQVECPVGSSWNGTKCQSALAAVPVGSLRDERSSARPTRAIGILVTEIQGLLKLKSSIDLGAADRPQVLRRIAEDYVELEHAAFREKTQAEIQRDMNRTSDPAGAGRQQTIANSRTATMNAARAEAIKSYITLVNEYSGAASGTFPTNPPPAYAQLDEVLYYLAFEYEQSGDFVNARRVYYDLIQKRPASRFVPNAYLAFGELFFNEAQAGDASKWELAKDAYQKVVESPPPSNGVYGYGWYKLALVYSGLSDISNARLALNKVTDWGATFPQSPGAAALADAARQELGSLPAK